MNRVPVIPTILVTAAVAAMIALGIWQWQRRGEKEVLLALYRANSAMPAAIAYPAMGPVPDKAMFRKSSANCLKLVNWSSGAGKDAGGKPGIRYIAECTSGPEGPGLIAAMGVSDDPDLKPDWRGGQLSGTIVTEPDRRSLLQKAFGKKTVLRPMLIADTPPPGMRAAAQPRAGDIPNNHLLYVFQWFFFAGAAALIYALALRKKWREEQARNDASAIAE